MRTGLINQVQVALVALTLFLAMPVLGQNSHGVFMVVKGDVKLVSGASKSTTSVKVGDKVYPSDKIITGADSRAKIVMTDKNIINVSPDTNVSIDTYVNDKDTGKKKVDLSLLKGKIRSTVKEKYDGENNTYNVKTPTAVAGVRGTDFLTSFDPKTSTSKIITFHGRVEAGVAGPGGRIVNSVMVGKGNSTEVRKNEAPRPPVAVSDRELLAINEDSAADGQAIDTPDDNRVPSSNEDSSSQEGSEAAPEPAADDSRTPAASTETESSSSSSSTAMVSAEDTSVTIGNDIKTETVSQPVVVQPMPVSPVDRLPTNTDFINEQIKNATTKVEVIIKGP